MAFLSKSAAAAIKPATAQGGYLQLNKLNDGESVRLALLSDEPLEFYECWGQSPDGALKPFRFDYEPTTEDINAELGDFVVREKIGGGGIDLKFAIALPIYNFETNSVQVLSITQKGLIRELDSISQSDDYGDLLEWDLMITKIVGANLIPNYKMIPCPRKKASQAAIDAAWSQAKAGGFDISRLIAGGNPFKAS